MEKSSGHKNSPDSQHTYWRDSGCLPAETASRTCNCFTRSNFGDTRYLANMRGVVGNARATVQRDNETEN